MASRSKVVVLSYEDDPVGEMPADVRPTRITMITLRPRVRVTGADPERVDRLLRKAHDECYIANSLTTTIVLEPTVEIV